MLKKNKKQTMLKTRFEICLKKTETYIEWNVVSKKFKMTVRKSWEIIKDTFETGGLYDTKWVHFFFFLSLFIVVFMYSLIAIYLSICLFIAISFIYCIFPKSITFSKFYLLNLLKCIYCSFQLQITWLLLTQQEKQFIPEQQRA